MTLDKTFKHTKEVAEKNKKNSMERIIKILMNHKSEKNAITVEDIAYQANIDVPYKDSTYYPVRKKIKDIIKIYGLPIASCSKGYYIISDVEELKKYIKSLESRIEEIEKRKELVIKNCVDWKEYCKK